MQLSSNPEAKTILERQMKSSFQYNDTQISLDLKMQTG